MRLAAPRPQGLALHRSVVLGSASGSMDGVAVTPLTVDFHEGGFRDTLAQENALGFWFQLSDEQRQQHGSPMGPQNVQALNRYSYVLNNPMRYTDPTGHDSCESGPGCGGVVVNNTDHSIWIVGSVMGPCPDGSGNGVICENVLVEIPAGKTSADMGVADADAIIVNRDTMEGFKITNSERAIVSVDQNGNTVFTFEAKEWWLVSAVGAERAARGITDLNSRKQIWPVEYVLTGDGAYYKLNKRGKGGP